MIEQLIDFRADKDGFIIWDRGGFFCRKCGTTGWLDDNRRRPISAVELQELRMQALEAQIAEQNERLERLEEMHACEDHLLYHADLTDRGRELWYESHIYDEAIGKFVLGYAPECPTYRSSPSLTVPVYDIKDRLVNIRHRLLNPNGAGKYRPHRAGLGTQLYNAPILKNSHERLIIVEGEKKVICMDQAGFPAVGIMGKAAWEDDWFDWFDVGAVYIALDPDADDQAQELGTRFVQRGFQQVRICDLPVKPDDFLYADDGGADRFDRVLKLSRPPRKG